MDESQYMPYLGQRFAERVKEFGFKPGGAKELHEASAYMQGALDVLVATGAMTEQRRYQISFLFAVGRGVEFLRGAEARAARAAQEQAEVQQAD
ncbi:MAG: hypothetical protein E6Q97_28640 [Desulfurellales bacterium]|nr:MAG: hypothetical protein E6Q97_28640 [Desulfurellales bacterium]